MAQPKNTRVFLTGAYGNWGRFTLRELAAHADKLDVVCLVLPQDQEHSPIAKEAASIDNVEIVTGSLTNYDDVLRCVTGADYVMHLGGMVSPVADVDHNLTHHVNIGAIKNIIRAVKAQPNADNIGVMGVGSVAETGDRNPPHHWGRIGDPLIPSKYEEYGQSKIIAERILVESGLKKWAWVRCSGILHPGVVLIQDPIMTHTALTGVLEWILVEDAARLVRNIVLGEIDPAFWCDIYNLGSGEDWRLTNYDFLQATVGVFGVDGRNWYNRNWFATRNFHGQWYTDSDDLEALTHFRSDCNFDNALKRMYDAAPATFKLSKYVPSWLIRNVVLRRIVHQPRGLLKFAKEKNPVGMQAYFGGYDEWKKIGGWDTFIPPNPSREMSYLNHGYDESKAWSEWTLDDYKEAAAYRGGEVVTEYVEKGDYRTPIRWRDNFGHEFMGSPYLILRGGHWCPKCVRNYFNYEKNAEHNPFLAQLELDYPQSRLDAMT